MLSPSLPLYSVRDPRIIFLAALTISSQRNFQGNGIGSFVVDRSIRGNDVSALVEGHTSGEMGSTLRRHPCRCGE